MRTIKCRIEKTTFDHFILYVYVTKQRSSYYHIVDVSELDSYKYYYNVEKIYPNNRIFKELYPDAIEDGEFLLHRELKIE